MRALDVEFGAAGEAEQGENIWVAVFDQGAGGVSDDPVAAGDLFLFPAFAGFDDDFRVVFGDVVQVVGD